MAAISADSSPEDILPALARNVVTNGYQASHSNDALEQTEYLKLVHRYLTQARELDKLAGEAKVIRIENCESATVAELLRILGFRMRGGCGSEVVLETVNAARAFLTTDSGFPLNDLEQALRTNRPFTLRLSFDCRPGAFRPRVLDGVGQGQGARRLHRLVHLAIRRFAGCISAFPSSTARPPRPCGQRSRSRASRSSRTCWTSSAGCSKFAAERRWFRADSAPPQRGPSLPAPLPTRARSSSTSS